MCVSFDLVRPENYKMKRTFEPLFPRPIIDRYSAPLSLSLSRPRFFLSLFLFSEKKKEKLEIEQDRARKEYTVDRGQWRSLSTDESRDSKGMADRS